MAKGVGVGFECKHDQPYFSFPTPLILPSPCSDGIYSPELSAGGRSGCKLGGSHTYCPFQYFMPIRASPGVLNTHCNHQPIKCNPLLLQCPLNATPPPFALPCKEQPLPVCKEETQSRGNPGSLSPCAQCIAQPHPCTAPKPAWLLQPPWPRAAAAQPVPH